MELRLPPELENKLARVAEQRGVTVDAFAREALERAANYDEWFVREVEKGLETVDRGEVLTHEEMGARLRRHLSRKQIQS